MAGYVGRDAVIVGAVRTPIGKGKAGGALHDVLPVDLLAHSLSRTRGAHGRRPGADRRRHRRRRHPGRRPGGQHRPQRRCWAPGSPSPCRAPPSTASAAAASRRSASPRRACIAGAYDIVIAAGVESMGRVPMGSSVLPGSDPFGAMAAALPRGPCAAGHQRRADRRQVGLLATAARRVLGGQPRKGRRGNQRGPFRQ